jgi:hypothetical protein
MAANGAAMAPKTLAGKLPVAPGNNKDTAQAEAWTPNEGD